MYHFLRFYMNIQNHNQLDKCIIMCYLNGRNLKEFKTQNIRPAGQAV